MLLDTLEEGAFVLAENLIEPAIVKVPAENISKFLSNKYKTSQNYMYTSVNHNCGYFSFLAVGNLSVELLQTEW